MRFRHQLQFIAVAVLCLGFLSVPHSASAQDASKVEVAAGWSFLKDSEVSAPAGWFLQAGTKITDMLGVVAQVSGNYKTQAESGLDVSTSTYTFLAGPKVSMNQGNITPFGQVLIGLARSSGSATFQGQDISESANGFAIAPGGGVDVSLKPNLDLRVGANVVIVRSNGETDNALQLLVGLVFHPGQ